MRVYNKFVLRSNVDGKCVYLGKQGQMTDFKSATRFSREQVKQMADAIVSQTPFLITPVIR